MDPRKQVDYEVDINRLFIITRRIQVMFKVRFEYRGGPERSHRLVAMVAMVTLTALAFEPGSRGVVLSLSGSKRPTRC